MSAESLAAFKALAGQPHLEVVIAAVLQSQDAATGEIYTDHVTNGAQLFTGSNDSPPNTGFLARMLRGWQVERRIGSSPGTLLGSSSYAVASLVLHDGAGRFAGYEDRLWNNQPVTVYAGGRRQADGHPYAWSLYHPVFTGVADDVERTADGNLEVHLIGRAVELADNVVDVTYRGFGGAFKVIGNASPGAESSLAYSGSSGITWGPPFTVEIIGRHRVDGVEPGGLYLASDGVLLEIRDMNLALHPDGYLISTFFRGGSEYFVPSSHFLTEDEPFYAAVTVAADGKQVKVYAGRDAFGALILDEYELPSAVATSEIDLVKVGDALASHCPTFDAWEARVWSSEKTRDELEELGDAPLTTPTEVDNLVECWKFGEGTELGEGQEIVFGELGLIDLAPVGAGTPAWGPSLEGDDPEQFEGSLIGQTKPGAWGRPTNIPLAAVSTQFGVHQWSHLPSHDLVRLRVGGAPMVPEEVLEAANAGDIELNSDDTITLLGGLSAHRFIPGQSDPSYPGQRVEIADSGGHDAIYRVAVDGISADGATISVIADDGSGAAGLPTASLPAGTKFRTPADDAQYSYDLTTSTVTTAATGELTADVIGQLLGAGPLTASALFEILAGAAPETSELAFDPEIALAVVADQTFSVQEALDLIARSCIGWWVEARDGSYRMGNHVLPTGGAVATIAGSPLTELDDDKVLDVRGHILKLSPVRTKVPSYDIRIGWGRTWHVQDRSNLVGSVPPGLRERLTTPYRYARRTLRSVIDDWPTSKPLEPIDTLITNRGDAETALGLAVDLFAVKLGWWQAEVAGLGLLTLDLYDTVVLQHPHAPFGLVNGVYARILAMDEDSSSDKVTLELVTA